MREPRWCIAPQTLEGCSAAASQDSAFDVRAGISKRMTAPPPRTSGFIDPCIPTRTHKVPAGPDWARIASPRMLLDKFSPMTGATSPNRFGVVNGETNQHERAT
jgi:hypothetical protein